MRRSNSCTRSALKYKVGVSISGPNQVKRFTNVPVKEFTQSQVMRTVRQQLRQARMVPWVCFALIIILYGGHVTNTAQIPIHIAAYRAPRDLHAAKPGARRAPYPAGVGKRNRGVGTPYAGRRSLGGTRGAARALAGAT